MIKLTSLIIWWDRELVSFRAVSPTCHWAGHRETRWIQSKHCFYKKSFLAKVQVKKFPTLTNWVQLSQMLAIISCFLHQLFNHCTFLHENNYSIIFQFHVKNVPQLSQKGEWPHKFLIAASGFDQILNSISP